MPQYSPSGLIYISPREIPGKVREFDEDWRVVKCSQGKAEGAGGNNLPQDTQKYIFNENSAKFLYCSAQNPAREIYSGHSWVGKAPLQEEHPLQDKFLATLMRVATLFITTKLNCYGTTLVRCWFCIM